MSNPFTPKFESLPTTIPVFPLPGAVVMPGTQLPLNVFEPRYLNLVLDALGDHRMFGMIQPDPQAPKTKEPALCSTGCAGRITSFSETGDGRIVLVLTGVCRFDVQEELPTLRGYRKVVASWSRYAGDYAPHRSDAIERAPFLRSLRSYCEANGVEVPWKDLATMSDDDLVNLLTAHLPLDPTEKQALVEAVELEQRAKLMAAFLDLGSGRGEDGARRRH